MTIVTQYELDELVEHLAARPDIWILHGKVWLRILKSTEAEPQVALGIMPGPAPQEGLFVLSAKNVLWSQEGTKEYVLWLLEKYTAYTLRQQIIVMLTPAVKPTVDVQILSRDLCELHGGSFVRRYERRGLLRDAREIVDHTGEDA